MNTQRIVVLGLALVAAAGAALMVRSMIGGGTPTVDAKPAPDVFLFAAQQMKARPERTLVIEDSVNGVLAGKAAGMTVWGFTGGSHHHGRDGAAQLREAGADRILRSFAEFAPEQASVA